MLICDVTETLGLTTHVSTEKQITRQKPLCLRA